MATMFIWRARVVVERGAVGALGQLLPDPEHGHREREGLRDARAHRGLIVDLGRAREADVGGEAVDGAPELRGDARVRAPVARGVDPAVADHPSVSAWVSA
jgi:hypothetical protein